MKLKSLIAFAGVACAAASYGTTTVTTSNTLCRIKFTTTEQEVLIGLPLVDVGGTTQTINATNYISTVGLPDDTTLFGKDSVSGKWSSWVISQNAWAQLTIVADASKYVAGDNASFTRGSAVRLKFNDKLASHDVYLYGQVATTAVGAAVTATRTTSAPTYTLLSNINAAEIDINDLKQKVSCVAEGDKIAVISSNGVGQKEYTYADGNWKEDVFTTEYVTVGDSTISTTVKTTKDAVKTFKAGEGFWYITAKGTGDVTFTW